MSTAELRVIPGGRASPSDLDAERAALGAVLIRPSVFDDLAAMLVTDDFFLPAHREVFEAMTEVHRRRVPFDAISLADELRTRGGLSRLEGGEAYIMTLAAAVPSIATENVGHYTKLVKEKSTLRKIIAACGEIASRAYGDFGNFKSFLAEAEAAMLKATQHTDGTGEPVRIGDDVHPALEAIERRAASPEETPVRYGLERLDAALGGLRPSNVIVVAGRPGMGKTALAVTAMVNNALRGIPGLLFSLEMERAEVVERVIAGQARLNSRFLRSGAIMRTEMVPQLLEGARQVAGLPLWIDDRAGLTLTQISATARRWYSKVLGAVPPSTEAAKPALIAIDYLQIMGGEASEKRRETRAEEIGRNTTGLKVLAKTLRVPILELSQLNREVEKRQGPPSLSDLRESGSIEQDADIVLFPWRELSQDPTEAARQKAESGTAQIHIGKNRHGAVGVATVHWIAEYTRFENAIADTPYNGGANWQDVGQ